jgi:hypothetical protein
MGEDGLRGCRLVDTSLPERIASERSTAMRRLGANGSGFEALREPPDGGIWTLPVSTVSNPKLDAAAPILGLSQRHEILCGRVLV